MLTNLSGHCTARQFSPNIWFLNAISESQFSFFNSLLKLIDVNYFWMMITFRITEPYYSAIFSTQYVKYSSLPRPLKMYEIEMSKISAFNNRVTRWCIILFQRNERFDGTEKSKVFSIISACDLSLLTVISRLKYICIWWHANYKQIALSFFTIMCRRGIQRNNQLKIMFKVKSVNNWEKLSFQSWTVFH